MADMFDFLNTEKPIRANARKGKVAEDMIRSKYEMSGYNVTRTGRGHDFRVSRLDPWTGEKEIRYVEAKSGNAKLSPLQRKKQRQYGGKYVVDRTDPWFY